MGTFFHPITLIATSGTSETLDALVDTGSSFSTVPRPVLERLGAEGLARIRLRLATGESVEREICEIRAQLNGDAARTIICVFGDADAPALIGAHTLEGFMLGVDPDQKRLVPLEGWWATYATSP